MRAEASLIDNDSIKKILKLAKNKKIDSEVQGILLEALSVRYNLSAAAMKENALTTCLDILGSSKSGDLTLRQGARALFDSKYSSGIRFEERKHKLIIDWCLKSQTVMKARRCMQLVRCLAFPKGKLYLKMHVVLGEMILCAWLLKKSPKCLQELVQVLKNSKCLEMIECVAWIIRCVACKNDVYTPLLIDDAPKILLDHVCTYGAKAPRSAHTLYQLSHPHASKVTLWECKAPYRLFQTLDMFCKQTDREDTSHRFAMLQKPLADWHFIQRLEIA